MGGARAAALLAIAGSALVVAFEACAVDPYLTCGDGCDGDAGVGDATTVSDAADSADAGSTACEPRSCENYPGNCGSALDDGCGQTLDCSGACPNGQACVTSTDGGGSFCNGPPICEDAGAPGGNCGTLVNPGNGLSASCGTCAGGFACSSNVCTCGATVCGGKACCSGATPNCVVGEAACCKLKTCAVNYVGKCGVAEDDGCGATIDCHTNCAFPQVCDVDSGTCCSREAMSTACTQKCGIVLDNCGYTVNCGNCANGDTCYGPSDCTCGTVMCLPGQTCNKGGADHCD